MLQFNPNQRIAGAYGDIFTPNTSYTDKAAAQLYAEQKQRETKQEQMNNALDEEFAKNLSGVKDIDIPEVTKAYGDWKLANQQAMKQKNGVPPEQQLDVLRKKADIYKVINASKQQKAYEEDTGKGVMLHPDLYSDEAHDLLIKDRQTPISILKQNGRLAADYSYKGTNTDFAKISAAAAGQSKQVYADEAPVDKEGIQTQITPYHFGNTPLQFYQSFLGSLAQHGAGRDANAIIAQTPPQVISHVQDLYHQIPADKWKKMGVTKPQDLDITPEDTPPQIYAKHEAQLYALNNEPKQGLPVFKVNEAAKLKKQQDFEAQKQREQFAHTERMAREKLGVPDTININDIYKNIQDTADSPNTAILQGGKKVGTRVNTLNADAQKVVIDYANKLRPNEKIGNDNIFLDKEADGTVKIYKTDDSDEKHPRQIIKDEAHLIGELPKVTANLPAQPGVKEKRAVIAQGNTPVKNPDASIHINDVPAGTKLVQKKGKYYYNGKEVITE